MGVTLDKIAARGRAVLREQSRGLQLAGVHSTVGGSERVELLVAIDDDPNGPGRFMVNVTRSGCDAFEHDLRSKLDVALRKRGH